jgi:putative transcriptional regulator
MSPTHHPFDARLFDYAAGALPTGQRLVMATHLSSCAECAGKVAVAEAVGGALVSSLPPAAMAPDALDRALARIERPQPPSLPSLEPPAGWIRVPREVVLAARRSKRHVAPGVWLAPVVKGPGASRTYLLGMKPGRGVPHHDHSAAEFTCVLKGAFADGDAVHQAGDFDESSRSVRHSPTVVGDGECVCLISSDGPLIGLDWLGRILIPLMGV